MRKLYILWRYNLISTVLDDSSLVTGDDSSTSDAISKVTGSYSQGVGFHFQV